MNENFSAHLLSYLFLKETVVKVQINKKSLNRQIKYHKYKKDCNKPLKCNSTVITNY